jgi:ABC-2 type transport system permease protein
MATIIQGYVNAFAQTYVVRLVANQLLQVSGQTMAMPVGLEPRIWYNPELKSSMFLIPGLIVYILILVATISTAISVVRERERGTIEQLLVSPLTPAELIIGKTIPYIFLGLLDAGIVLWVSYIFFGLTIKGSALLLFLSMILFILAGLAQGILISAATSSQQVAFQLASLLTMLPTLLLSGFIYPIRNMILPLRIISHLVPARYFINVIRGILLKGVDAHVIWQDLLWLGLFTLVMLLLAIRKLGKTRLL